MAAGSVSRGISSRSEDGVWHKTLRFPHPIRVEVNNPRGKGIPDEGRVPISRRSKPNASRLVFFALPLLNQVLFFRPCHLRVSTVRARRICPRRINAAILFILIQTNPCRPPAVVAQTGSTINLLTRVSGNRLRIYPQYILHYRTLQSQTL